MSEVSELVEVLRGNLEGSSSFKHEMTAYSYAVPPNVSPEGDYCVILPQSESRPQDGSRTLTILVSVFSRADRSSDRDGTAENNLVDIVADWSQFMQEILAEPGVLGTDYLYNGLEAEYDLSGWPTARVDMTLSFTYYQFI